MPFTVLENSHKFYDVFFGFLVLLREVIQFFIIGSMSYLGYRPNWDVISPQVHRSLLGNKAHAILTLKSSNAPVITE